MENVSKSISEPPDLKLFGRAELFPFYLNAWRSLSFVFIKRMKMYRLIVHGSVPKATTSKLEANSERTEKYESRSGLLLITTFKGQILKASEISKTKVNSN